MYITSSYHTTDKNYVPYDEKIKNYLIESHNKTKERDANNMQI